MTPHYEVILEDSKDITDNLRSRLISLTLVDSSDDSADLFTIVLSDRDRNLQMPDKGGRISVRLGYKESGMVRVGDFFIDETSASGPPDQMTIRGDSADFLAGMKEPHNKNWDGFTLGAIVDTIAGEVGFESLVQEELRSETFETLSQTSENYNQFLYRLSKGLGAVYKPNGQRLVMVRRDSKKSQSGQPLAPVELHINQLINWKLSLPDKPYYQNVRTWWFDEASGQYNEIYVSVTESDESTESSSNTGSESAVPEGMTYTLREYFRFEKRAQSEAKSILQRLQKLTKTLEITTLGYPNLLCEVPVTITGGRSELNQEWIVGRAEHVLNATGYTTKCVLTPYVPYK